MEKCALPQAKRRWGKKIRAKPESVCILNVSIDLPGVCVFRAARPHTLPVPPCPYVLVRGQRGVHDKLERRLWAGWQAGSS